MWRRRRELLVLSRGSYPCDLIRKVRTYIGVKLQGCVYQAIAATLLPQIVLRTTVIKTLTVEFQQLKRLAQFFIYTMYN
jgi:hypothetical protein